MPDIERWECPRGHALGTHAREAMSKGETPFVCGAPQDGPPGWCQARPVLARYVPEAEVERLREDKQRAANLLHDSLSVPAPAGY